MGPFRCPRCNALVVDRRLPNCTTCQQALPAEMVMTADQAAKMNQIDRNARAAFKESMRTLDPLNDPNAPAIIQFLNQSNISGTP